MKREEVQTLLTRLFTLYPLSFSKLSQAEKSVTVDSWYMFLAEYDNEDIKTALQIAVKCNNSGFAPTVGEIIDKLGTVAEFKQISEPQAWDLVSKAIRNSNHARESFDDFPEEVKEVVRSPSQLIMWGRTETKIVEGSVRRMFTEAYANACKRKKEFGKLPVKVKNLILNDKAIEQKEDPFNKFEQRKIDIDKLEKELLGE